MTGVVIMPHTLPSFYRLHSSTLSKFLGAFLKLVSLEVKHSDPLTLFGRGTLVLLYFKVEIGL